MEPTQDLPEKVQSAISAIMEHRAQISRNGRFVGISYLGIELIAAMAGYKLGGYRGVAATALLSTLPVLLAYDLYSDHFEQYQLEYRNLFRAVKGSRNDPRIRQLLKGKKDNYLIVDRNGRLIQKPFEIGSFARPIGRRRIPNPLNKEITRKWQEKMKRRMKMRRLNW